MQTVDELRDYDRQYKEEPLPNGEVKVSGIRRSIWKECLHCGAEYHACDDYNYSCIDPLDFMYCPNDGVLLDVKWEDTPYTTVKTKATLALEQHCIREWLRRANPELIFEKFGKKTLDEPAEPIKFKRYEPLT